MERPWRENLRRTMEQVEKINRSVKEADVSQINQFEEFTARQKNDEWIESYHRKLVKNDMLLRESDMGGPALQLKIQELEKELDEKRGKTSKALMSQYANSAEANDFWDQVPEAAK